MFNDKIYREKMNKTFEVFIKDLDEYLINDVINGNTQRQQTFESTVESVGSILKDKFAIEYELI